MNFLLVVVQKYYLPRGARYTIAAPLSDGVLLPPPLASGDWIFATRPPTSNDEMLATRLIEVV